MGVLYLLYESASGYALLERTAAEEITPKAEDVLDLKKFSAIVKLKAFLPFESAESALENQNAISEGDATKYLLDFIELNLPKGATLGVSESKIGNVISETAGVKVKSNETVLELLRGVRMHFTRLVKVLKSGDAQQAMLGLAHSYSRSKVKFNVHRVDNMIIQSSALLDQLDKDLNTFSMRVREWYSWHFPELQKIVNDNYKFAKLAVFIQNKADLSAAKLPGLEEICGDSIQAQQVLDASRMSMGTDISPIDMLNIESFATRVVALTEYRKKLHTYLLEKMNLCAPNLSALIGEQVGARLISHAGSLTNLAKYPASTVQILGAEKALFRALKTKSATPKYGLIFHSSFIGRAGAKHKGRISRYLANKCSMASRIDSFSDVPESGAGISNVYGTKLKAQVEERLEFYKTGAAPRRNIDVMHEARKEAGDDQVGGKEKKSEKKAKKEKKKEKEVKEEAMEDVPAAADGEAKKAKKEKRKREEAAAEEPAEDEAAAKKAKKEAKKAKKAAKAEESD